MSIARTSSGSARTVLRFVSHLGLLLAVIAVVLLGAGKIAGSYKPLGAS